MFVQNSFLLGCVKTPCERCIGGVWAHELLSENVFMAISNEMLRVRGITVYFRRVPPLVSLASLGGKRRAERLTLLPAASRHCDKTPVSLYTLKLLQGVFKNQGKGQGCSSYCLDHVAVPVRCEMRVAPQVVYLHATSLWVGELLEKI